MILRLQFFSLFLQLKQFIPSILVHTHSHLCILPSLIHPLSHHIYHEFILPFILALTGIGGPFTTPTVEGDVVGVYLQSNAGILEEIKVDIFLFLNLCI